MRLSRAIGRAQKAWDEVYTRKRSGGSDGSCAPHSDIAGLFWPCATRLHARQAAGAKAHDDDVDSEMRLIIRGMERHKGSHLLLKS